jgi:hypothetical protein
MELGNVFKVWKKHKNDTNSITVIFGNLKNRYGYVQLYRNNTYLSSYTCVYDDSVSLDTIHIGAHARSIHKLPFSTEVQCKFIGISDLVSQNNITISVSPMHGDEKDIIFIHQEALIDDLLEQKVLIAHNKMIQYMVDDKYTILCVTQNNPDTTCGFLNSKSKVTVVSSHQKIVISDNNVNIINKDMFSDNFNFERNFKKEREVYYDILGLKDGEEFIFIHEDILRFKSLNRKYINEQENNK